MLGDCANTTIMVRDSTYGIFLCSIRCDRVSLVTCLLFCSPSAQPCAFVFNEADEILVDICVVLSVINHRLWVMERVVTSAALYCTVMH